MVDSHCHLDLMDDIKRIAESCQLAMIGLFAVGTTPKAYAKEKEICHHHSNIKVGLGMHPQLIGSGYDDIELFSMLAKESRYIGEVGLDFSKEYLGTKEAQILSFERVVKSCETYGNKVISVHALKSAATVLQIIEEYRQCKENIYILHWFTGSLTQLEKALNLGCYFSINPKMTKTKSGQEIIKFIPDNRILIETDAPFAFKYSDINQLKVLIEKTIYDISVIKNYDVRTAIEDTERRIFL